MEQWRVSGPCYQVGLVPVQGSDSRSRQGQAQTALVKKTRKMPEEGIYVAAPNQYFRLHSYCHEGHFSNSLPANTFPELLSALPSFCSLRTTFV